MARLSAQFGGKDYWISPAGNRRDAASGRAGAHRESEGIALSRALSQNADAV